MKQHWNRLGLAWHVFRGRPLLYGFHLRPCQEGDFLRPRDDPQARIVGCLFEGWKVEGVGR